MKDSADTDSASARIAFLRGLRAVRQLRPDPLPETVLHNILEVARWSGSAGNRQPWEFVVVRGRDMLHRLSAIDGANPGHLGTAAAGIAIVIHPEAPDLDAYHEGRLAERILLAAAARTLATSPDPVTSTCSKRPIHPVESHSSNSSIGNTTDAYLATRR